MSRNEVPNDFDALLKFIEQYSIKDSLDDPAFKLLAKQAHRRLLAYLTCYVELSNSASPPYSLSTKSVEYIAESASDLTQMFFCWLHGAYKPASLSLRSSIETFMKGVAGTQDITIFEKKSVYEVFDIAKTCAACSGDSSDYFDKLRQNYAELCKVSHTANIDTALQANALILFPRFNELHARNLINLLTNTANWQMAVLLAGQRDFVEAMHFKNKQVVLNTLPKGIKGKIYLAE